MITPETIAAIRAAYDAATPGEWYDIPHPEYRGSNHRIDNNPTADHANFGQIAYMSANNAALTCLAHNALPALLDALEEARAVIAQYHEATRWKCRWCRQYHRGVNNCKECISKFRRPNWRPIFAVTEAKEAMK